MKTATDPRHMRRITIVKDLFAQSFLRQPYTNDETRHILSHIAVLDEAIAKAAPEWPLSKVAKVDLAVLRLAVYELMVTRREPPKVIVDEAVELAKEFGGETSGSFINGVLGTIIKKITTEKVEK